MAVKREQVVQTAEKYVARGKIEPAIREYRKLLEENPNDINTLNRVGDLYARIQRIDEAVDFFNQIAEQYAGEGFFVKAIAIYKKIIKLDPTRLDVYENLAELYHRQGLVTEARTQYQVLADYYQKHENATSTIAIYQKMAELEPDNPTYHVKLAELYHQQQLIDKAMGEYRVIAELMMQHGHPQEAAQVYERALAIDSTNLGFITDAALKLQEAAGPSVAARFLAAACERNPQASQVARLVGGPQSAPAGLSGTHAGVTQAPPASQAFPEPGAEAEAVERRPAAAPARRPAPAAPAPPPPQPAAPPRRAAPAPPPAADDDLEFEIDLGSDLVLDEEPAGPGAAGPGPPAHRAAAPAPLPAGGYDLDQAFEIEEMGAGGPPPPGSRREAGAEAPVEDEDVFVLDIENDDEPASLVKPPPDMLREPRRPSWAQTPPPAATPPPAGMAGMAGRDVDAADAEAAWVVEPELPAELPPLQEAPASEVVEAAEFLDLDLVNPFANFDDDAALAAPSAPPAPFGFPGSAGPSGSARPAGSQPGAAAFQDLAGQGPGFGAAAGPAAAFGGEPSWAAGEPSWSGGAGAAGFPAPSALSGFPPDAAGIGTAEPGGPPAAAGGAVQIDSDLLERTAAEIQPQAIERYEDLVSEAEVLAKYGLKEKAVERLRDATRIKPRQLSAYLLLLQLHLEQGHHAKVLELANQVAEIAAGNGDRDTWPKLRRRLLAAGYRIDGERVVAVPGAVASGPPARPRRDAPPAAAPAAPPPALPAERADAAAPQAPQTAAQEAALSDIDSVLGDDLVLPLLPDLPLPEALDAVALHGDAAPAAEAGGAALPPAMEVESQAAMPPAAAVPALGAASVEEPPAAPAPPAPITAAQEDMPEVPAAAAPEPAWAPPAREEGEESAERLERPEHPEHPERPEIIAEPLAAAPLPEGVAAPPAPAAPDQPAPAAVVQPAPAPASPEPPAPALAMPEPGAVRAPAAPRRPRKAAEGGIEQLLKDLVPPGRGAREPKKAGPPAAVATVAPSVAAAAPPPAAQPEPAGAPGMPAAAAWAAGPPAGAVAGPAAPGAADLAGDETVATPPHAMVEPSADDFYQLPPLLPVGGAAAAGMDGLSAMDGAAGIGAEPAGEIFNPLEIGAMVESEEIDWDDDGRPLSGTGTGQPLPAAPDAAAAGDGFLTAGPEGAGLIAAGDAMNAAGSTAAASGRGRTSAGRPRKMPSLAPPPPEQSLDDTGGMSWLDEADSGRDKSAARAASLFDEEEDFFDLAGELEQELSQADEFQGSDLLMQQEQSLEEIVEGFKRGVAEHLSPTDYDTHFNLGIAYREMGLLDEAIGEFQLSAKDPRYLVACCSMLGLCFLDKGLPELAIKWYRRGLDAQGISEEDTLGLLYDMGCAYLAMGDNGGAYKTFVDVYGINTNYRDVVARIEELGHPH